MLEVKLAAQARESVGEKISKEFPKHRAIPWIVRILVVFILREERQKICCWVIQNLPANESVNRVENLDEEIGGLMNVPVEETHTITKVKFNV